MGRKRKQGKPRFHLKEKIPQEFIDEQYKVARREGNARYLERVQAVDFLNQGKSRERVAELLRRRTETILDWIKLYNKGGFDSLKPIFPATNFSLITPQIEEELKKDLRRSPVEFGYPSSVWTGKLVASHLEQKFQVHYHPNSMSKVLKRHGITSKKPRPINPKKDPKAVEAFQSQTIPDLKEKKTVGE